MNSFIPDLLVVAAQYELIGNPDAFPDPFSAPADTSEKAGL
jgi:hypothetical protein